MTVYNWYEDHREGLGDEFLTELVSYYKKLEIHPTIFGKITSSLRQAALKKISLHYSV